MLWYCILLTYQTIVGDLAYLTGFDVLYPVSTVSQKNHYCSMLDYAEAIRIVQYISANPDQASPYFLSGTHSFSQPTHQLLDVSVSIFISADSSHRKAGRPEEAGDQIGCFVKLFFCSSCCGPSCIQDARHHYV